MRIRDFFSYWPQFLNSRVNYILDAEIFAYRIKSESWIWRTIVYFHLHISSFCLLKVLRHEDVEGAPGAFGLAKTVQLLQVKCNIPLL